MFNGSSVPDFTAQSQSSEPTLLSELNKHERDPCIQFFEETHTYIFHGITADVSVTGLIQRYCHQFNAPEVIARMMASKNWPRPGYLKRSLTADVSTKLLKDHKTRCLGQALLKDLFFVRKDVNNRLQMLHG